MPDTLSAFPASPAASDDPYLRDGESTANPWLSASAWIAFWAGILSAFTVSLVGDEPVGELLVVMAAGWAVLCFVCRHAWPGPLIEHPYCRWLLAAQCVALCAYIFSDLYRHSFPHDIMRGWSRMIFLGIDVLGIAYLFGLAPRNFILFQFGLLFGDVAHTAAYGALFGDVWKFGVGSPLTYLAAYAFPIAGVPGALAEAIGMGWLNFFMGFRSLGGICLLGGAVTLLQQASPRVRMALAPFALAAAGGAVVWIYSRTEQGSSHADRSDIERSAMVTAAAHAFESSPLIGSGSWFSNTRVYDEFMMLRYTKAQEAHVGGFADPNHDPGDIALHSQFLVALAEGGIFGAAFFAVYAGGLARTLGKLIFVDPWERLTPFYVLFLLNATWDLFFSPFSGEHRLRIAATCGLMLVMLHQERLSKATRQTALA